MQDNTSAPSLSSPVISCSASPIQSDPCEPLPQRNWNLESAPALSFESIPPHLASASPTHEQLATVATTARALLSPSIRGTSGLRLISSRVNHCRLTVAAGTGQSKPDDSPQGYVSSVRELNEDRANSQTESASVDEPPLNPFTSGVARDALMAYAYHLYESSARHTPGLTPAPIFGTSGTVATTPTEIYRTRLLPLLSTLRTLHPDHLPLLLLLACTHHELGEYDNSLAIGQEMLIIDPNYVEAMCNLGTTVKAMGQTDQAYEWWWKALQIQPMYWDAMVSRDPEPSRFITLIITYLGQYHWHVFHTRPECIR